MVGTTNIGLTYKPADISEEGTIVLRSCNIRNGKIDLEDLVRVKTDIRDNQYIEENDILICARNGSRSLVGKCAVMNNIGEKASFGAFMAVFRSICYRYVYHYFNTLLFRSAFDNDDSKQINQVTQAILRDTMIPLPPFAEQERIISTLDETFALVDLVNEETENIESLIKSTKAHILDLAIRGKLVPQNLDDEPASVLLERIRAEKEELIKQGKIKRDKKESIIFKGEDNSYYEKIGNTITCIDDELPFEIPETWTWSRIEYICNIKSGVTYPADEEQAIGEKMYVKVGDMNLALNEFEICGSSRYITRFKSEHLIPQGSIIFPKRGGAIATNKKKLVFKDSILIDLNTMAITPHGNIDLLYFYYWFQGIDLAQLYNGTSIPQINNRDIAPLLIPIPPAKEQKRIANVIQQIYSIIRDIEKSLN